MATTNIKGFLLTFSFSPRFWELWRSKWNRKGSSCVHMWTSRACVYNKWECTKCYVFGWFSAVLFRNEDSSYNQRQLGLVNNGQQLWKDDVIFWIFEPLSRWSLRFSEIYWWLFYHNCSMILIKHIVCPEIIRISKRGCKMMSILAANDIYLSTTNIEIWNIW